MDEIKNLYNLSITHPHKMGCIDIHEHMPVLKAYGEQCESITEMGVRGGASTLALIMAEPKSLISYDIHSTREIENIMRFSEEAIGHQFIVADCLTVDIEPTDLLFIDTLHTYNQLTAELNRHEAQVEKFIILHDTTTFARVDEGIYGHASDLIKNQVVTKRGLRTAMEDFLEENKNWEIFEDLTNNNGLTILRRVGREEE